MRSLRKKFAGKERKEWPKFTTAEKRKRERESLKREQRKAELAKQIQDGKWPGIA